MLGDMRGERFECRELEDRGGSRLERGCDCGCGCGCGCGEACWESLDGFLCGLRNMCEVVFGT